MNSEYNGACLVENGWGEHELLSDFNAKVTENFLSNLCTKYGTLSYKNVMLLGKKICNISGMDGRIKILFAPKWSTKIAE